MDKHTTTTIAIFDFDGTITKKDTLFEFIKFTKGAWLFYFALLLFSPLFVAMKLKLYPNGKAKEHFFSFLYKGISIEKFNRWGKDFSSEIEKILRYETIEALNFHKLNGAKIIIISASIENWIKPWTENMDIETLLATKIEINKTGLLTGRFATKNCYGKEKVKRLSAEIPDKECYHIIVYGDSRGDKELFHIADERHLIKGL